jgi:hypothetical protein
MTTPTCFIEVRKSAARGTDSIVADAMRHLHCRQHLGKAVIVCGDPTAVLSAARKQWLKLSRSLQKRRASTLNADKILKYTHTITRMQHMRFSPKSPLEQPDADVYFLHPNDLSVVPVNCWSIYLMERLDSETALQVLYQLPNEALIIDYHQSPEWEKKGLHAKKVLESRVSTQWRQVHRFLDDHHIQADQLIIDGVHNIEAMDDALDVLLSGYAQKFLQVASEFQRSLELARPLRLTQKVRSEYDSLVLLAHRVQALTPGAFAHHFLEVYDENDTFFLYDPSHTRKHLVGTETFAQAFARHKRAGRHHLARSLQFVGQV